MATVHNIIVDGNVHFTERSTKDLQEVYANVARENHERCQLSVFRPNALEPFRTFQLAGGETFGIDSGVIQQTNKRFLNRGKPTVQELHYVSIVQRKETLTLVLKSKDDRRNWKAKIAQILDLDMQPKKMALLSVKEGSQQVTLHQSDTHISVLSERIDHQPAELKLSWQISDIKSNEVDGNLFLLKDNHNIEYRLECCGHRGQEELEKLNQHIIRKKRRMKHPPNPVNLSPSSAEPTPDLPAASQLPSHGSATPDQNIPTPRSDGSSEGARPKQPSRFDGKRPRKIPLPPPAPCPGPDPFVLYSIPLILRHFKPTRSDEIDSLNLEKFAETVPENLDDAETFAEKRTSLFRKFNKCLHKSLHISMNPDDVPEGAVIDSPFEDIQVSPSIGTQTDFGGVSLDEDEQIVYGVGYIIHKVIHKPPEKDTLKLPDHIKKEMCMMLYPSNIALSCHDWTSLANEIGMTVRAVNLIRGFIQSQMTPGYQTCAEVVIRHWQYTYNKYPPEHRYHPKYPCTQSGLKDVLRKIGRHDLCQLLKEVKTH